ncbi:MAG: hypothetical protein ACR2QC_12085 [Gammaproteobacteria bacterium]
MAVLFVFADNTEFGGIRKYKNTAIPAKAGISFAEGESAIPASPTIPLSPPPSHSCEGRNLRRREAAGNCTFVRLRRQFAPTARRFLPSQEWDGLFNPIPANAGISFAEGESVCAYAQGDSGFRRNGGYFLFLRTIPNLAVPENIKIPPFRRKPESL